MPTRKLFGPLVGTNGIPERPKSIGARDLGARDMRSEVEKDRIINEGCRERNLCSGDFGCSGIPFVVTRGPNVFFLGAWPEFSTTFLYIYTTYALDQGLDTNGFFGTLHYHFWPLKLFVSCVHCKSQIFRLKFFFQIHIP